MGDLQHGTASAYSYHRCRCEVCVEAKRQRDRDYYRRNAEKIKARATEYYETNKESIAMQRVDYRARNAETLRAKKKAYYEANRDKFLARTIQWEKDNPERVKANKAKFRENHREERRQADAERYRRLMTEDPERIRKARREWAKTPKGRAYQQSAQNLRRRGVPYTSEALEWIASLVDPLCQYCGEPATEIDHVIPISKGGTGERSNLVPACRPCNARKGSKEGTPNGN